MRGEEENCFGTRSMVTINKADNYRYDCEDHMR